MPVDSAVTSWQSIKCGHSTVSLYCTVSFSTLFMFFNVLVILGAFICACSSDGIVSSYSVGSWSSVPSQVMFLITASFIAFE